MSGAHDLLAGAIPYFHVGEAASPLFVLSGGQAFMRKPSSDRLRRDGARVRRFLPKGTDFTIFGYGPRHYAESGLDELADSFAAVLSTRSGPVQLVGVSYGGVVASRMAARHPGLVSDLVLVSSAAAFSEEGLVRIRRQIDLASQRRYAELMSAFGGVFRRPWYNWLLRARLLARRGNLAGEMRSPEEIVTYLRAALSADGPDILSRITARTLVIGGDRDQFFGRKLAETAAAISDARLHLFPRETHMAPLERASAFRTEITRFLAGPSSTHRNESHSGGPSRTFARETAADV